MVCTKNSFSSSLNKIHYSDAPHTDPVEGGGKSAIHLILSQNCNMACLSVKKYYYASSQFQQITFNS